MAVYLVTYDLNRETVRPNIVGAIKKYGDWARLSESSYAIDTTQTASQVFETLKPLIDQNDSLYVIPLGKPYRGFGPSDVNKWLDDHM